MKDGGPAFPQTPSEYFAPTGMSLRDWFAGQALAGIGLAAMQKYQYPESWAKQAYDLADAMLKAREVQS